MTVILDKLRITIILSETEITITYDSDTWKQILGFCLNIIRGCSPYTKINLSLQCKSCRACGIKMHVIINRNQREYVTKLWPVRSRQMSPAVERCAHECFLNVLWHSPLPSGAVGHFHSLLAASRHTAVSSVPTPAAPPAMTATANTQDNTKHTMTVTSVTTGMCHCKMNKCLHMWQRCGSIFEGNKWK